jgi:glutathione S-transferase
MAKLGLNDPPLATHAMAAATMILEAMNLSWLTVARVIQENGGSRSSDDNTRTTLTPDSSATQIEPSARVERIRRLNSMQRTHWFAATGARCALHVICAIHSRGRVCAARRCRAVLVDNLSSAR